MKAGVAQRDITPAAQVKLIISRMSEGVHDPLFARVLVLDDGAERVAIVCLDLPIIEFDVSDRLRKKVADRTGIRQVLINCSHTHSSPWIGDTRAEDLVPEAVEEALAGLAPVLLRAGRAPVQVGFNRRITNANGQVHMGVDKTGPIVPWVNVLVVEKVSGRTGNQMAPLAVLFEHAAHPVSVHEASSLISADYPGAACTRVREKLGAGVLAMFAQGCCGNINSYPLAKGHAAAESAGSALGDAVVAAAAAAIPIAADKMILRSAQVMLPCREFPTLAVWQQARDLAEKDFKNGTESGKPVDWVTNSVFQEACEWLADLKGRIERGESPSPRRFDANLLAIGQEWALVTMPHEMFCEYEIWVGENAPFRHTMVLSLTNGHSGYVATDAALALGERGGYEAGCLPCWWAHGPWSENRSTPAVGTERRIRDALASLWAGLPLHADKTRIGQ